MQLKKYPACCQAATHIAALSNRVTWTLDHTCGCNASYRDTCLPLSPGQVRCVCCPTERDDHKRTRRLLNILHTWQPHREMDESFASDRCSSLHAHKYHAPAAQAVYKVLRLQS